MCTDQEIADQFQVSASSVRRWRRTYGIQSRCGGKRSTSHKSKISDEMLLVVVPDCYSVSAVCRAVGLIEAGQSHRNISQRLIQLGVDTSHFGSKKHHVLGTKGYQLSPEVVFTKGTQRSTSMLKRILREEGLPERCSKCGMGPEWQKAPLSLHLDHVDGDPMNNQRDNLRLLCPNCHSQTVTYTGRNKGKRARRKSE